MGWMDTLLNAATAVSTLSAVSSIYQAQQDQAASAEAQELLRFMREQVFELKQMAAQAVDEAAANRKVSAIQLLLLASRVENIWIKPNLFPDNADKEYAENVYKTILKESDRIFHQLTNAEKKEVKRVVAAFLQLTDVTVYLNHFEQAQKVREAQARVHDLEGRNKTFMPVTFILLYLLVAMVVLVMLFARPSTDACVIGVAAVAGLAVFQSVYVKRRAYTAAKQVLEENQLDMELFSKLEAKFESIEKAQEQQMDAEAVLTQFREDNPTADAMPALEQEEVQSFQQAEQRESGDKLEAKPINASSDAGEEEELIYECTACGKQVKEDMSFCPYCGEKFE